jgi:hypothetical protein
MCNRYNISREIHQVSDFYQLRLPITFDLPRDDIAVRLSRGSIQQIRFPSFSQWENLLSRGDDIVALISLCLNMSVQ